MVDPTQVLIQTTNTTMKTMLAAFTTGPNSSACYQNVSKFSNRFENRLFLYQFQWLSRVISDHQFIDEAALAGIGIDVACGLNSVDGEVTIQLLKEAIF